MSRLALEKVAVGANVAKSREARQARVRQALVLVVDDGAYRRHLGRQARADVEALAVRHLALERADVAPTGPRKVPDHQRLGVVDALDLEQRVRALAFVEAARLPEHEALAVLRLDGRQLLAQVLAVAAARVGQEAHVSRRLGAGAEQLLQHLEPLLEAQLLVLRCIKDVEGDCTPRVGVGRLLAHDRQRALEGSAAGAELAVERHLGQTLGEPRWCRVRDLAVARKEVPAAPVGAHAIHLL